jgi:3-oxoacyl-[acyl-carrier protein] reductase
MQFGLFGSASARRPTGADTAEFDSAEGFRDFIEYNVEAEALDLAADSITANQVVVGTYDTRDPDSTMSAEQITARANNVPLGREGLPQDMADLIRVLCGPAGAYITGQTIHSNGGAFMNS